MHSFLFPCDDAPSRKTFQLKISDGIVSTCFEAEHKSYNLHLSQKYAVNVGTILRSINLMRVPSFGHNSDRINN